MWKQRCLSTSYKIVKGAVLANFNAKDLSNAWEMYCPRKSLHFTHCKISFWIILIRFDLIRRSCQINLRCRRPKYNQESLDKKYAFWLGIKNLNFLTL
jgi:hypothetical protein